MFRHEQKPWRLWVLGGVILLGLAMAGTALAQQAGGPPPHRESFLTSEDRAAMGQIFWNRTKERLGLTDQQATEIRALLDAQRTAARTNVQSLIAARKELRTLLEQPTVDSTAVQGAATQVKTQQAALFDARLQTQLALRAKLTPEQWQQWQTLRKGHGRPWMRRGQGFGPGM
jgi:Spy/CpxP family protein refolding chaperone